MKKTKTSKSAGKILLKGLGEKGIHKSLHFAYTMLASAAVITAIIIVISVSAAFINFGFTDSFDLSPMAGLVIILCAIVIITVILLDLIGRMLLKPVNQLTDATEKISKGDYSVRVDEASHPEELKKLTQGFNRMTAELESTEILRNDFVSNFSHEFKTPIVSIKGFAKQLKNGDLSEEQKNEYIDIIINASERLANLSSEILLLSKYESLQIVTDKTEFYLDEQLRMCVLFYEKQWSDKNISLDLDLDEIKYYFNSDMLYRVWSNIILNAIKFTPENGLISISCKKNKKYVIVKITDNGKGMDEETVKNIFVKFYQGDSSHSSIGNGLGLCLAKRVVDLCGGKIKVKSEPGKGTCFTVKLPY